MAGLPHFGSLAGIIISGNDRRETESPARNLRNAAPHDYKIMILGPAEAPMALVRGRFRFRILIQTNKGTDLQKWLRQWMDKAPKTRGSIRVQIDIDPQSFL
jgi:primosomal protein N' (replication factor Y)